jgi:hypothetical protein
MKTLLLSTRVSDRLPRVAQAASSPGDFVRMLTYRKLKLVNIVGVVVAAVEVVLALHGSSTQKALVDARAFGSLKQ